MQKIKNLHYLMIMNIIILLINVFYSIHINIKENLLLVKFKNVDNKTLCYSKKTFKEISKDIKKTFVLNIKSKLKKIRILLGLLFKSKKTIVIFYEDNHNRKSNYIIKMLKKKYDIKLSNKKPDYLLYNVFGCNHLNNEYNDSIKIAIFTENQIPDFNIADYAISHSHINYLDRHLNNEYYFLNYFNYFNISYASKIRKRLLKLPIKQKFCAAVISNFNKTDFFRLNFIKELSKYKKIDMGGKYNNNVGTINNKIDFLSNYKFSIAMENTEADGYSSEKILESFLSGTIPIYYGNYMIDEYINPKSFILIRGEKDMMEKIKYIKKIDNDDELYRNILKENILIDKSFVRKKRQEYEEFLFHIFEQNKKEAKRVSYF